MSMRQFRALLINPRPRPPKWRPPNYKKGYRFGKELLKRHFLLIICLTIGSSLIIGVLTESGTTFSTYDNYDIDDTFDRPEGWLWEILWVWRGQPAGWEESPDAFFPWEVVAGVDPVDWIAQLLGQEVSASGLNGPITPWGITTEWFVDLTIFLPKFLDPDFILVNADLVVGFFIKFSIDLGVLIIMLVALILLGPVLGILIGISIPYIIQWISAVAGPLLKIILVIVMVGTLFLAFTNGFDPFFKSIQDFINQFIELLEG